MSKIEVDTIAPQSGTTVTLGESGDTVNIPSGVTLTNSGTATGFGISWQSDIKTSAFTAVAGEGYWINTTSAAVTVTLPAAASVGDTIEFADYARTWQTNNVTINTNSLNYQGNTSPNPTLSTEGQHLKIVYSGATNGWIPTNDDPVALGTPQTYDIDYLVVAGGGAGATNVGAGGGAGGMITGTFTGLSAGDTLTATIGAGGAGNSTPTARGGDGVDTTLTGTPITNQTAIGGGGGGSGNPANGTGSAGGSGGGGSFESTGGSGTAGQGNDGGDGASPAPNYSAAGGGGAGAVGGNSSGVTAGDGGDGLQSSITGSATYYAGGGGGFGNSDQGSGGLGGGGTAVPSGGGSGTANTGGGGGGVLSGNGGDGGSGVVILSMPTAKYSGTTTGSPTVTTSGSNTILTFTGTGTYTT